MRLPSWFCLAPWLCILFAGSLQAAPVAKPAGGVMSAEMAAVVKETQARIPWYASIRAYDVDVRALSAVISRHARQVEILLPTHGLVRFELQSIDHHANSSSWSGESQQGDRITFSVDNIEDSILAHLTTRDGRSWQIHRLTRTPQYVLVEMDRTKLPRGNDALPVPPRTPATAGPAGAGRTS